MIGIVAANRSILARGALVCFAGVLPAVAHAQLRPLEQSDWSVIRGIPAISARIGAARLFDQRASLAGTTGDLWDLGSFAVAWQTGRVVIEAGGTVQRLFRETSRFDEPYADVENVSDGNRNDSGDYRISTSVRLTPAESPVTAALRFGTRLPTTDNTTGLERDAVDFFTTIGAAATINLIDISGELGLGIHTTREPAFEQEDVLLYSIHAEVQRFRLVPSVTILGQRHGTGHAEIRGAEDLGEARLGIRIGRRRWLRIEAVRGYETFSPESGVIVTLGTTLNLAQPGG